MLSDGCCGDSLKLISGVTMTQEKMILNHLRSGNSLTPLEALGKFGCLRLGARVYDLKQRGHPIEMKLVETESGKHVAEYRLPGNGQQ